MRACVRVCCVCVGALFLLNGNGFRRGFLRTVPVRSRMCHGQLFFQNGFQHGRYLQNGRSKSSFMAITPKWYRISCSFLCTLPAWS